MLARLQPHSSGRAARCMRLECVVAKTHRGWWWLGCGLSKGPKVPQTTMRKCHSCRPDCSCIQPSTSSPSSSYTSPGRPLCRSNRCTLVPKKHHQANLGELCSFPEPVPNVVVSQPVQDMGGTAQNGCSRTAPHKLISRYQTKPLQCDSQGSFRQAQGVAG